MKHRIITCIFAAVIIVGIGLRIWYVNTYPDPQFVPPETEVYQIGDWVELDGDFQFAATESTYGYAVKLESVEFMTPEVYADIYNIDISLFQIGTNGEMPELVADLTMNFRNNGGEEGHIEFTLYSIYSDNDLRTFSPLANVNDILHPEMNERSAFKIYPGTESGSNHFCLVSEVQASGTISGNYENFPKYLQITTTPTRKVIEIPKPKE